MVQEIWKAVDGFSGLYEVSNYGRVRSLDRYVNNIGGKRFIKGRILAPRINRNGYSMVNLSKEGKAKNYTIHKLVGLAFIPNPNSYPELNHKNEIKTDNTVENLEWMSRQDNCNYGTRNKRVGEKNSKKVNQFTKTGEFIRSFESQQKQQNMLDQLNQILQVVAAVKQRLQKDINGNMQLKL